MGIYKITCLETNDFYIGSTETYFAQRWSVHKSQLRAATHRNYLLQELYNKHGLKSFVFEVIEVVDSKEFLFIREQYYMDILRPSLNIFKNAGSSKGRILSEEHKRKIGDANRGRIHTEQELDRLKKTQFKKGQKSWLCGKKMSKELRQKISLAKKGKVNIKKRKKVEHNGIIYTSLTEASKSLGRSCSWIYKKINNGIDFKYV